MERSPQHRFAVLDGWRGVAALMVAIYHFHVYSHIIAAPFTHGAYLFVDFFFVLSGFVISYSYGGMLQQRTGIGGFVIRRFGRLWPLHVAMLSFLFAIELIKLYVSNHGWIHFRQTPFDPRGFNSWSSLPTNFLLIQALGLHSNLSWNVPAWSIGVEFWTYLVFAALCWSGKRSLAIGGGTCIVVGLLAVMLASKGMNVGYDYGFFRCIFGFFIGHFTFRLWQRLRTSRKTWIAFGEIPAILAVILFLVYAGDNHASILAPLLFGPVVLLFAMEQGIVSRFMRARPIEQLGAWSYSIYMVHAAITDVIFFIASGAEKILRIPLRADFPNIADVPLLTIRHNAYLGDALFPFYLAITVMVSALTYRWIENPGRRFFNELAVRRRVQRAE